MTLTSYAQNYEDVLLWRAFGDRPAGCYIDVGAQDPVFDSVSLVFYERGWRGIHVEATPAYAAKLRQARPDEVVIEAAVSDDPGPIEFFEIAETGLSTGSKSIADGHRTAGYETNKLLVPSIALAKLLELAEGEVQWLKIDVEGMEASVLRSWGKSARRPWVLVIEATAPNSPKQTHSTWIDEVLKRGYQEAGFDGLSRYFVHENHADLAERFAAPANVFDGFCITGNHFTAGVLKRDIDTLKLEAATARSEIEASQARSADLESQLVDARKTRDDGLEQLRAAHAERIAAVDQHQSSLQKLVDIEREWRAATEGLWREFSVRETTLRQTIAETQASASSKDLDLSRLHERAEQLEAQLERAVEANRALEQRAAASELRVTEVSQQAADAAQRAANYEQRAATGAIETEALRSEFDRTRANLEEQLANADSSADQLRRQVAQLHGTVADATSIIRGAAAESNGWWQSLGQALRLSRRGAALRALDTWHPLPPDGYSANFADHTSTDAIAVLNNTYRVDQRNPYLRANSLTELLAWNDLDFVRCAYVTVLGRQPDLAGEQYYAARLRSGCPKMEILRQLRRSPEGPEHDPGIAGFDRALKRASLQQAPIIGAFFRMMWASPASIAPNERQFRAIMNAIEMNGAATRVLASQIHGLPKTTIHAGPAAQSPQPSQVESTTEARAEPTVRLVPEHGHLRTQGPLEALFAKNSA